MTWNVYKNRWEIAACIGRRRGEVNRSEMTFSHKICTTKKAEMGVLNGFKECMSITHGFLPHFFDEEKQKKNE